jgi:hypothetical protein
MANILRGTWEMIFFFCPFSMLHLTQLALEL